MATFSRKLQPAERNYSTFDRELLGIYGAIKHFRHFVEGRQFHVLTDHKPLTFLPSCQSNRHSPRQVRHLDYILQFTSDICHIRGTDNAVADALSRVHSLTSNMLPTLNLQEVATAQTTDSQLETLSKNPDTHSLTLRPLPPILLSFVMSLLVHPAHLFLVISVSKFLQLYIISPIQELEQPSNW